MRRTWVLVHSPLVGPSTWSALRDELRARGDRVYAPDLGGDEHDATPLWQQHARPAADALRDVGAGAVLVGHSGAGGLLPAIRDAARTAVGGYIFVDAGLPAPGARKGDGAFAARVDAMHASGRRFPEWTDADLRDVIPDDARRASVLAEMRPQPARFWDEALPVFEGWPDAPCTYLRFAPNPSYDDAAGEARRRGWPYREIGAGHFHMLVGPAAVADALASLADEMERTA